MGGKISKKLVKTKTHNREGANRDPKSKSKHKYSKQTSVHESRTFGLETHNHYDEFSRQPPPPYRQFDLLTHPRDSGQCSNSRSDTDVSRSGRIPGLLDVDHGYMENGLTSSNPNLSQRFGNDSNLARNPSGMSNKPIYQSAPEFDQLFRELQLPEAKPRNGARCRNRQYNYRYRQVHKNASGGPVRNPGMSKKPIYQSAPELDQLFRELQLPEAKPRNGARRRNRHYNYRYRQVHNNTSGGPARNSVMSLKQLQNLSRNNSRKVVFTLQNYSSGFIPLLNENDYIDQVLVLVLDILAKVCANEECPNTANALLQTVLYTKLFNVRVVMYLQNLQFYNSVGDLTLLKNLFIVLTTVLREFKKEAESKLGQCLELGRQVISQVIGTSGDLYDGLLHQVRIMNDVQRLCKKQFLSPVLASIDTFPGMFRIASQPSPEVKVVSDYDYKVQQFRIVQDDFNDTLTFLLDDSGMYRNVRVTDTKCSFTLGLIHKLTFDTRDHQKVSWNGTIKLLEGSTVFLANDFWEDLHCATVVQRNPEELSLGSFWVKLLDRNSKILSSARPLVMSENFTYNDDFISPMQALHLLKDCKLPFSNYIFGMKKNLTNPQYLQHNSSITFPFTAAGNGKKSKNKMSALNPVMWPTAESFKFDGSFYEALKHALTKELAVIQCRPTTDYIDFGYRILQVLLHNASSWHISSPVLVLFNTNETLDKFLKMVLAGMPGKKVVRIGGQLKNVGLHKHELSYLRTTHAVPPHVAANRRTLQNKMKQLKYEIESMKLLLERVDEQILRISVLKSHMSAGHFKQLMQKGSSTDDPLLRWLSGSLSSPSDGETETEAIRNGGLTTLQKTSELPLLVKLEMDRRVLTSETEGFDDLMKGFDPMSETNITVGHFIYQPQTSKDPIGFIKGKKAYLSDMITYELKKTDVLTSSKTNNINDVFKLKLEDRWKLYRFWKLSFVNLAKDYLKWKEDKFEKLFGQLQEVTREVDVNILQMSRVMGMTMAAAAKHHHLLKIVAPRIAVVQEAGRIPECKLVSCLTEHCQHLILIGDHQQLKPTNNGFKFAERSNNLTRNSLFEKLISKGIHHVVN